MPEIIDITDGQIAKRLRLDNPWWREKPHDTPEYPHHRLYFSKFHEMINEISVRRAVLLMGPRRVGKTVMIFQAIEQLLEEGIEPKSILFCSIDHPVFLGLPLEKLLDVFRELNDLNTDQQIFVFFDEIQYLNDWEVHLKVLVDRQPKAKFIASGSAAAALRMKSIESGAGRFTDFSLPPLTFFEFIKFVGMGGKTLNERFIEYINYGGFPEAVFNENIRNDVSRYVGRDVVDKVLLRDLPSIYGIDDPRELNQFFSKLALNTGNEINLESLSNSANLAKQTIKKYLDYLEAAFLIKRIHRIDQDGRTFKRITSFKVYLTNPSLRSALFGPIDETDPSFGHVVETAVLCQLMQTTDEQPIINYARWKTGEVDFVVSMRSEPNFKRPVEVKWSDNIGDRIDDAKSLAVFCKKNGISEAFLGSKSAEKEIVVDGVLIQVIPIAILCALSGMMARENRDPDYKLELDSIIDQFP